MKKYLLKELCSIRTGISDIKKGDKDKDIEYSLIQLKDVSEEGSIGKDLSKVFIKTLLKSHIIKKDEIIFKAKSVNNSAAIIKESGKFVATSHYLILKVKDKKVIIYDYLWWYLNERYAQRYFKKIGSGTISPIIKKKDLENLEVIVPPIEKQMQIIEIYNLWLKEKELLKEQIEKKDEYIKELLMKNIL